MKNALFFSLLLIQTLSNAQITDIDGNSYDTVRIGTQTWMSENLNVSHFRNGDAIAYTQNVSVHWKNRNDTEKI